MSTTGKTITCKAAIVWEFKKPIAIETVQVSPPKAGEVRLKMQSVALCHSDLHILDGNHADQPLPLVIGHEGAGIVESVGEGVTSVVPGDKALTLFIPHCKKCKTCQSGRSNLCEEFCEAPSTGVVGRTTGRDGTVRFSCNGKPINHLYGASAFAEYTVISENSCIKIDSKTKTDVACILACGFSTGYGTAVNTLNITPEDTVAVWGLGGVGLAAVFGCKEKKAKQIIGIDLTNEKEPIARKFGITTFIAQNDLKEPVTNTIKNLTDGRGVDFALVCIGNPKPMEDAVFSLAPGGTMVIVGVAPTLAMMNVSPAFMLPSRRIIGSCIGDYKLKDDLPLLADKYNAGKLPLEEFISHRFKLEQINEACTLMKSGKSIRSVIEI